jgi:long-chain acyl-CoA synthetase
VRESSVPALYTPTPEANLTDLTHTNATEAPDAVLFGRKVDGAWQDVTAARFRDEVTALAKGFVAAGVNAGDRVGIMARTCYEWTLLDFAIWEIGAVPVPVYETSSAEQVQWIASDSGLTGIVVENETHLAVVESVRESLPDLRQVWRIDAGDLDTLAGSGGDVTDDTLAARRATLSGASTATIIYTSGTTGRPKGCQLTHGNLMFELGNATGLLKQLFHIDGSSTLLFLPLAHVFARIIEIGCVMARCKMGHCPDQKQVVAELATFRPTFILAVPRVFERVYNGARQKAQAEGKGRIFDAAAHAAIAWSKAQQVGGSGGLGLRLKHGLFDKLVYGKLRAALGGRTEFAISGGAPLGADLMHFFRGIGLTVLEGYGLTENSAAASVNPANKAKGGTVGPPVPGTSIAIADDGEVLLRGPHLFQGYWHNEEATAAAFTDGWFHTGDLGELDDDGYLRITGRKKELIVTAGGKNVAPHVLEDRLTAHPLIGSAMVVGDAKPFIAALVTLDPEALPHWKSQHGKPSDATVRDLIADPDLRAEIQHAVDEANKAVSRAESIRKFQILDEEWTVPGGQLTPKLSLRRQVVMAAHKDDVEALYTS